MKFIWSTVVSVHYELNLVVIRLSENVLYYRETRTKVCNVICDSDATRCIIISPNSTNLVFQADLIGADIANYLGPAYGDVY